MDTDVIVYAIVAIGLALWLRSILGTKNTDERTRPNPFSAPGDATPLNAAKAAAGQTLVLTGPATAPVLASHMAITGPGVQETLSDIARADRAFDLARFMNGAQDAFVLIVESFAAGDRDTLRGLLGDNVYAAFDRVIESRAKAGQTASVEIHAVRRVEAVEARLDGKNARITVRFVSDQTDVLKDVAGTVLQGNPDRVSEIVDVWSFARDLRAKDPSWLVVDTREEASANVNPLAPPSA